MKKNEKKNLVTVHSAFPLSVQVHDPDKDLTVTQKSSGQRHEIKLRLDRPVLKVRANELRILSQDELKFKVPRVHIALASTWDEFIAAEKKRYESRLSERLPAGATSFLRTVQSLKSPIHCLNAKTWISGILLREPCNRASFFGFTAFRLLGEFERKADAIPVVESSELVEFATRVFQALARIL